jgi:lipopolysaccharide/colanic/teichoic acid biosynthesis glycosyltransferase
VGKGGRTFVCWKFRTMRQDAEALKASLMAHNEASGHIFKMRSDPRRTRVGVFLRKSSVDELPQLWNVLRGEMSLVGPRPPVPAEVAAYAPQDYDRLAVEPGITGLWQVTLRGRHDFQDMVVKDREYARRRGVGLDAWILLRTVTAVLRGDGSC